MAIMESLLAVGKAYKAGKAAFDWLNAKNDKFQMTPEERRAKNLASRQAALGTGSESFTNAANQLRAQSADASAQVRANAFTSGLENSAVTRVGQQKVNTMTNNQLADLALKISDRNIQFRERASQRKEQIDMAIGERKRQFNETRKAKMSQAGSQFFLSVLDLGVQAASAKEANAQVASIAAESEVVNKEIDTVTGLLAEGKKDEAIIKMNALSDVEFENFDMTKIIAQLIKMLPDTMQKKEDDDGK